MIRLLPYCLPLARRVSRPFRRVSRGTGVATAAKFTAGAIILGGRVCFDVLMWGGGAAPVPPAALVVVAHAALPSQSVFGSHGGSIYGALDARDFAALVPLPGVSVLPLGNALVVLDRDIQGQPVSVPEPSSLAIMAGALVLLAIIRSYRNV